MFQIENERLPGAAFRFFRYKKLWHLFRERPSSSPGHAPVSARSTAIAFAREGSRLLICARRLEPLEELQQTLTSAGASAVHIFQIDVQKRADVEAAIANLPADWREIDVLVNNAGLSRGLTKIYEDDPQNWEEMIDTNVKGLLYVTRSVVPGMVARGHGHVINLGSTAAYITYANGAVYCASKAAEKAISEGLKIDLMGTAVRVTSVDAGMVETNFSKVRFRGGRRESGQRSIRTSRHCSRRMWPMRSCGLQAGRRTSISILW